MQANLVGKWVYVARNGRAVADPLDVTCSYTTYNEGILDVAADAQADDEIVIPLGTVDSLVGFQLVNKTGVDLGVRFNAADADAYRLAPGGVDIKVDPVAPSGGPITSITLVVKTNASEAGTVEYLVFGDPPAP